MKRRNLIVTTVGILVTSSLLAACGNGGTSSGGNASNEPIDVSKPVEIAMQDIKFDQTALTVKSGDTVNFRFVNTGKVPHDAFIGDGTAQAEHEDEMKAMAGAGDMSGHAMNEAAVTVQPGESDSLAYTFDTPGTYEIGCHQPGHYTAGMKVTVTVT